MKNYKLYIDVLYAVSNKVDARDIEVEVFGQQQFELLNRQLNMTDIITVQASNPLEAINKASVVVKEQYTTTNHIGYYRIVDGSYGYLEVQCKATHIQFADERDEEYEDLLEEINAEYYNLIA